MIEVFGDLWTYPADVRVITTNGTVKKDGSCVMGRGCAFEAKQRHQNLDKILGSLIKNHGNHVHILFMGNALVMDPALLSFPVKHNWYEKADADLIRRSAEELTLMVDDQHRYWRGSKVALPRPGCGNGHLKWEDVRPILAPNQLNERSMLT
ncbi:MAG: ADP-ribose-binding protein [Candidatus Altimarinota bacterium]